MPKKEEKKKKPEKEASKETEGKPEEALFGEDETGSISESFDDEDY